MTSTLTLAEMATKMALLEERVRRLEGADPTLDVLMASFHLTLSEAKILGLLHQFRAVSRETMEARLYDQHNDPPETSCTGVFLCKLRKKMALHGITIPKGRVVSLCSADRNKINETIRMLGQAAA